jgi:threonine/homoserine/homoserine lactone efflux protein
MIDLAILPIFFMTIFFLVIAPGPDLVLISTYSSTKGIKAGVAIALGVFVAGVIQTLLVAFGLGQLMQTLPIVASIIKMVGALYLSWLGIKMLVSWYLHQAEENNCNAILCDSKSIAKGLFNKGLLNNLLNPKALLFFSLFLPQFVDPERSMSLQILTLGMLLSIFALLMNIFFSLAFSKIGKIIGNKLAGKKMNLARHIDGVLGLVFLALATRIATNK